MANDLQTVSRGLPPYGDGTPGYGRQNMVYAADPDSTLARRYPQVPLDQRRYVGQDPSLEGFTPAQSEFIPGQGTIYPYRDPYGYPTSTVFKKPDTNPGIIDSFLSWISNGAWEANPYWYDPRFMREPFKGSESDFMMKYGYTPNHQIIYRDNTPLN